MLHKNLLPSKLFDISNNVGSPRTWNSKGGNDDAEFHPHLRDPSSPGRWGTSPNCGRRTRRSGSSLLSWRLLSSGSPDWESVRTASPPPRPRLPVRWVLSVRREHRGARATRSRWRKRCDGPTGPAGTVTATAIVASTALKSPPNPAVGTVLVAKTSCPTGKVLLSGGAQVSAPGVNADRNVELRSSYPLSTSQWQTVAIVTGSLGSGGVMTMRPYVVCGLPTSGSSASTATTAPTG